MSEKMIPLDVPQIYVSEAYAMGAVFNRGTKAWEVPEYDLETFAHLDRNQMTDSQKADVQLEIADALGRRQYLDVPYESKDQAKTLGARYDGEAKAWYVEKGRDLKQFSEIDRNQWSQDKKQDYQKKLDDAKESKRANWKPMDIMYEDKIEAAKLGGHYNKAAKRWEAHNEDALKKFAHIDLNQMSAEQRKQHVAQNLERRNANAVREEHKDEIAAKATPTPMPEMLGEQQAPQAGHGQPHDVSELHDAGISDGTKNDITIAIDNAIARMRSYQDDKGISPAKEHWTDDAVGFLEEARNEISAGDVDGAAFSVHCAVEVEQSYPKESQDICVNAMRDFDEAMVNEMGKATWQARKGDFIEDVGQDVGQGKAQAKVQEKTLKMSGPA